MKIAHISLSDVLEKWAHFTPEQFGWATRLMFKYYALEKLYDDDADNARFCGVTRHTWLKHVKPFVTSKADFYVENGMIRHGRIDREIDAVAENKAKKAQNFSEKSAEIPQKIHQNADATQWEINTLVASTPTPTPTPSPKREEKKESKEGRPSEISGLNGSTSIIVGNIARMMNELNPDIDAAERCVQENCTFYGPDAVRDGYADLMADFADNKRMGRPTYKLLMSYFRQAKEKQGRKPQLKTNNGKLTVREIIAARNAAEV